MLLVTRAQLGWPASAAPLQAATLGTKVHYEGSPVSTRLLTDHNACLDEWKAIRASHLANIKENYSDIAYNYGACPHGYLLEGRGLGRRTGANGNQDLNRAHYAICGLVGSEGLTEPTPAMLAAIRDGIDLLRQHGAGPEIRGHRDGYATTCPGAPLYAWVQKGAPRPTTAPEDDMPTPQEIAKAVADYQLVSPTAKAGTDPHRSLGTFVRYADARHAQVLARLGALEGVVTKLAAAVAAGGGLTAAQITAAAQAGADAALDQLGDALTKEGA